MSYALELCGTMLVWTSIGVSLALPIDRGRMFLVCPAALCAIGAYSAALIYGGASPLTIVGLAFCALATVCLSLARLWHDELIVGSFAVQMVVFQGLKAADGLTGGDQGLRANFGTASVWIYVGCAVVLTLLLAFVSHRRSTLDAVATTIGSDPVWAATSAIDPARARLILLVIASLGAAFAGAIWAGLKGYLTPSDFDLFTSVKVILVVLIAGRFGILIGAILGAAVVVLLPELIRATELFSNAQAGHVERTVFGVLLILLALFAGGSLRLRFRHFGGSQ